MVQQKNAPKRAPKWESAVNEMGTGTARDTIICQSSAALQGGVPEGAVH